MVRHLSFQRQRVPMVDAVTLEGRTRPHADLPSAISMRLHYVGWSRALGGVAAERSTDGVRLSGLTLPARRER